MAMNRGSEAGKLVIVSGFAGSGKGTVIKELFTLSPDYRYSVSATTRSPRRGEIDGVDYCFLSSDEFAEKIKSDELLEYVEYSGNYYGTLKKPVMTMLGEGYNIVLEIEVKGAMNVKEKFPGAVMIFIAPPTFDELERRLVSRATESDEIIRKRLEISKWEINYICKYDYLIVNANDKQREVASEVNNIVQSCRNKTSFHGVEQYKINAKSADEFIKSYFLSDKYERDYTGERKIL